MSSAFMPQNMQPSAALAQVRLAGAADLHLSRIERRRPDFVRDNPRGADAAAVAVTAMHDKAQGHMATLGCRPERVTQALLAAEKPVSLEDLADWLHRDGQSRKVALSGIVALLASVGWEAKPCSFGLVSVPEAGAQVALAVGRLHAELALAQADGKLEPHELAALAKHAEAVHVGSGVMQTACLREQIR